MSAGEGAEGRVTPVNDWVTVIDSALSTCIKRKPAGQNLGMEALLNVGCRKVRSRREEGR